MGLGDYLRSVRRRWWVLALAVVVAVTAAVVTAPKKSPNTNATQFKATTVVSFIAPSSGARPTVQALAQAQATLGAGAVPASVAKSIGFQGDPAQLMASEVSVSTDPVAGTVTINAQDNDATRAAKIADGLANGLLATAAAKNAEAFNIQLQQDTKSIATINAQLAPLQARYDKDIAGSDPRTRPPNFDSSLTAQIDGLAKEIQDLTTGAAQLQTRGPDPSGFQILSKASGVPVDSSGLHVPDSKALRGLLGALVAVLLAAALVILFDRVDGRIRSRAAAEFAFGVPVLAEVPELSRRERRRAIVLTATDPNAPFAEAYRVLRTSLLYAPTVPRLRPWSPGELQGGTVRPAVVEQSPWQRGGHMTLLVVSPGNREGRTTTVANLAASLAETDQSVVAVDTDLRNPSLDRFLGLDPWPGLTDATQSGDPITAIARPCHIDCLLGITSGTPTTRPAAAVLASRDLLEGIHEVADVAVLDTSPLLVANDAIALLPVADAVVIVCRWGKTTTAAAWQATELLASLGARVAGVVLVGSPTAPTARPRRRRRRLRTGPLTPQSATAQHNGHRPAGSLTTGPTGDTAPEEAGVGTSSLDRTR